MGEAIVTDSRTIAVTMTARFEPRLRRSAILTLLPLYALHRIPRGRRAALAPIEPGVVGVRGRQHGPRLPVYRREHRLSKVAPPVPRAHRIHAPRLPLRAVAVSCRHQAAGRNLAAQRHAAEIARPTRAIQVWRPCPFHSYLVFPGAGHCHTRGLGCVYPSVLLARMALGLAETL